ncbi:MAG: WG repeat-containing protein [Bacteroidota bacterium]|uniref:WG repeat-containing protein n=1 Tax=Flagellimonas profundi TaxID=2915620 RepID=A0ABS3FAW2_9FLAO|nr:WG repeat-containing protein [Allomuricauda profundi]MBO0340296.1 WG repeat-containing protein [Allomuricauda profundi]MEC7771511.1 WG repeat-containing protein [Bacteroidota bacterium]
MKRIYLLLLCGILFSFMGTSQTIETINTPIIKGLDEVAPFSEGLAAVRQGELWGFIDKTGELVIDFRDDVVWNKNPDPDRTDIKGIRYPRFKDGLCPIQQTKDEGIIYYGFMDYQGQVVIEPEYLNVTEFNDNKAVGIYCRKTFRGKNSFQLNIYEYTFTEAILNAEGEIVWPIKTRDGISMIKKRYEMPELTASLISSDLIAIKTKDNDFEISLIKTLDKNHEKLER